MLIFYIKVPHYMRCMSDLKSVKDKTSFYKLIEVTSAEEATQVPQDLY